MPVAKSNRPAAAVLPEEAGIAAQEPAARTVIAILRGIAHPPGSMSPWARDPIRGAEADAPDPSSTPTARRPRRDAPVLVTRFRLASAASVP